MDCTQFESQLYVGIDLGDRESHICMMDQSTGEITETKIPTTGAGVSKFFSNLPPCRVAIEAGTHSFWIDKHLRSMGHVVIIANPRQVMLIAKSARKNDRADAKLLCELVMSAPRLLNPIKHRRDRAQRDLTLIKARAGLIESRTALMNRARMLIKPFGLRLPSCSPKKLAQVAKDSLPMDLLPAIIPLIDSMIHLTEEIDKLEKKLDAIAKERYERVGLLRTIPGVGPITAMAFVLTIDDPHRFKRSRTVGAYLGMVPRQCESGDSAPELGITKRGNGYLRGLLVNCAQRMLGAFGEDCDLRRWGLKRIERGGKNAKKRAVIGVARKLAVIMHRMMVSAEDFRPFRNPMKKAS